MNRFKLLLSRVAFSAILLFLFSSAAVYAQVGYTLKGTLNLVSGSDPLGLNGTQVTSTTSISQTMTPATSQTTSAYSTNTYSGVAVGLNVIGLDVSCASTPPVTVTLTDNVGAPDTIAIMNCSVAGLAQFSATATIPDGNMITAVPAAFPSTVNVTSGNISILLTGGKTPSVFSLTNATLAATGTPPPAVTPQPLAWNPTAQLGTTALLNQALTFSVSAPESFTTSVTTTDGGSWLSVSLPADNTSTPLTMTVNPTGLTKSSYSGDVIINYGPGYNPLKIPVTLTLTPPLVTLSGPASMAFSYTLGTAAPASQQLAIGATGTTTVNAAVTSGNSWLSVSPSSGTTPASFTVSVNTAGLSAGTLNGNIQITSAGATNSPLSVPVTFTVSSSTLTVPTAPLTFNYTIGGTAPAAQPVSITGTTGISYTAVPTTTSGGSWLVATPGGAVPSSLSVSLNASVLSGLSAGMYSGSVTVNSAGAIGSGAIIPITLNVTAPVLTVNTTSLSFNYQFGSATQPASQPINVGDASNVNFTAKAATTSGGSWLSVAPGGGSASGSLSVSVNTTGLAAGVYTGTVTIAATGATSQVVKVTLTVAEVTVSTSSLNFAYQIGGAAPNSQTVNIGGTPGLSFTATPAGGSWLSVNPGSGTVSGTSSISVSVNTTGLAANTYTATITVAAPGATSQVVNVTLVVSNTPTISASPSSLNFSFTIGGTAPIAQSINVGGSSGLAFTATVGAGTPWLSATPVSPGTVPGSVNVSVNTTGLAANTYNGTVTIGATGATSQVVSVTLVVNPQPTITALPSPLNFNYQIGATAPVAQTLTIGGTPGLAFTATVGAGTPWLSATPSVPATTPGSVSVAVNITGLAANTYTGTVTIAAAGAISQVVNVTLVVTKPTISAAPSSLSFTYQIGGTAPLAQALTITGTTGLAYTATVGAGTPWLSAAPVGPATAPGSVSVAVNTSGLAANTYNGTVTIAAAGATSQVVNVTLVVTAQPTITVSSSSLSFTYLIGGTAPVAQIVTIGGTTGLAFTATVGAGTPWLSAVASSPAPGSVSVSVNTAGLAANTYNGTVTIGATGAVSQVVNVSLVVTQPTITTSTSSLSFSYQIGGTTPAPQAVNIGGTTGLAFTATAATIPAGGTWLSAITVGAATAPGTVNVSINPNGLTVNTYKGTITIAASGATSQIINVTLAVTTAPISASPASLSFKYVVGATAPAEQPLNILGADGLAFTAAPGPGASWLSVKLGASGNLPILMSIAVNPASLAAGTYTSSIIVTAAGAPNSPFSIPVTLTVSGAATTITVTPATLSFTATTGAAAPASQTVNVSGTTTTPVSVSTQGGSWLTAAISGANTPATITVSVNQASLAAGTYTGTVVVTAASATDSPQNISVKFVVAAPAILTATPGALNFAYILGSANPASQSVSITSTQPVNLSLAITNGPWLTVSLSSSGSPATLTATVNPANLAVGTYSATVAIAGFGDSNSPQTVTVTLVVSGKPGFTANPVSLTFSAQSGGSSPASQSISLTGGAALPFSLSASPSWLSVSASASSTPSTLVATVNIKGLAQGSYQGAITLTSATAGNSPFTIPVALNVTGSQVVTGPTISSVVNAASYDSTGFSPGAIVSIFGSLLGPQTSSVFSVNSVGTLDSTLAGATVSVGGIPAIPLFVQNGQINVILPYSLGTTGQAAVTVSYNGLSSLEFNIPLTAADVQIFTANASGSGPGSILNQDYSVNTATNPAAPGTVVQVYGTGGGAMIPAVFAGYVAGDKLSWVAQQYSATVNGENATVLYAGSAPGLVYGVYQFNVQLPTDAPSGPVKIVLTVGDSTSQADVTVFVK